MNNNEEKALSYISLAAKAGKLVSGSFMVEKSIVEGTSFLVIIASDASENTHKKFTNKCKFYNVPCVSFSDSDTLGHRIGKQSRITVSVTEQGLAKQVMSRLCSIEDMEV
ncbi:MAG: ribosomal L7Ae/L30e/S12e/Gadd45 family protein [Lachnospiraceae bacterium]|nr:ribosomal L7Ae/L30e/S12e/Gadd45 family protein [Lachnospiraceae bacterium]